MSCAFRVTDFGLNLKSTDHLGPNNGWEWYEHVTICQFHRDVGRCNGWAQVLGKLDEHRLVTGLA